MNKRHIGLIIMLVGILAAAAGLGLGGYNLWDNHRAGLQADAVLKSIVQHQKETAESPDAPLMTLPEASTEPDDHAPPALEVDGRWYIGTVSIPVIDVELPVQEDWSLPRLKISPCRYTGSPYSGDLILCAHNYATHFGRLKNLLPGDEVIFTDMEGNPFRYTVAVLENLAGTAVEEMKSGEWDLTLFTCTLGGQARVTVRCNLIENNKT